MRQNNENWTQEQRLDYLVEQFKADSGEYRNLRTPKDTEGKRRILRSLMNIRMPGEMDESVLAVQDEYLQERIRENGIVELSDIPVIRDGISVWQGDITRLAVDAIVNAANSQMLGCFVPMHTCIDNCIHTFAGIQLRAECGRQMKKMRARYGRAYEQPTSVPMLTEAYNLPAKKVIHIVGPIVEYGLTQEHEEKLADCRDGAACRRGRGACRRRLAVCYPGAGGGGRLSGCEAGTDPSAGAVFAPVGETDMGGDPQPDEEIFAGKRLRQNVGHQLGHCGLWAFAGGDRMVLSHANR